MLGERSATVASRTAGDDATTVPTVASEASDARPEPVDVQQLVIVVPAYNEEDSIGPTIESLRSVEDELVELGCALRIYVVDDGSADATRERAKEARADRVVRHRANRGLGAAVRSGLTAARTDGADLVVKFDADRQHEASDIPALIQPILDDEADLVYGNRFERISYRMPLMRRAGNTVFTKLMAWLTGWPLEDSQPGIFAAHRSYLERFYLPGAYNYTQQILLDAYHKGARFAHVPVAFHRRSAGRSFVSLKYPFRVLPQILLMLATLRPLRVFVPAGLAFVLVGGGVFAWDLTNWLLGNTTQPVENPNAVLGFGLFGIQTVFFGLLGHLIIQQSRN